MMKIFFSCLNVAIFFAINYSCVGQDTLRLTLPETEALFVKQNLSLLAQKYNIDAARAQVIQARLFNNPEVQFSGNIYNPELRKAFDMSNRTGDYALEAHQLILLAGKRNKQIQLAETNVAMEESRFFDLIRTLSFSLRSDFYQLYFLQNSADSYALQIVYLESLNVVFQDLLAKGIVTLKDALRIKSLLYSLKAEQTSLQNQINDINAEMQLLIQNNSVYVVPLADSVSINAGPDKYTLATTDRFCNY